MHWFIFAGVLGPNFVLAGVSLGDMSKTGESLVGRLSCQCCGKGESCNAICEILHKVHATQESHLMKILAASCEQASSKQPAEMQSSSRQNLSQKKRSCNSVHSESMQYEWQITQHTENTRVTIAEQKTSQNARPQTTAAQNNFWVSQ